MPIEHAKRKFKERSMKNRNCNLQKAGSTWTRLFSFAFFTHGFMEGSYKPGENERRFIMWEQITTVDCSGVVESTQFVYRPNAN